ncbi:MAG: phosphatase PAP2 family protein [Treponema sp.]|jgi:membrane-associated phospholipid phosphatase/putative flippase GtrA|nr:phosphatase PAP2 family protein [Treponema sp.]
MEAILQWGLDFIRAVQTIASPGLTFFMRIITALGGMALYMLLIPFIYWCIDEKKGFRLALLALISIWINLSLKFLLDQPRPFFEGYDPSVGMLNERLGGLPSGHSQNTLVMLFMLAFWVKRNWFYATAGALCFLIGFSRVYLGVHFPTDVFAGWMLGGIILAGFFLLNGRIETLLEKGGFRAKMIASAFLSFIMIIYLPDKELLFPGGTILGICIGYCLNKKYVFFTSSALLARTGIEKYLTFFVRLLLGVSGLLLIFWVGDKLVLQIFPALQNAANYKLYGFVWAALCGFWVSFVSPWIFVKFRLAKNLRFAGTIVSETER